MMTINKLITTICFLILSGCDEARLYGGIGATTDSLNHEDWDNIENPVGFIRGEANSYMDKAFIGGFCHHTSSVPDTDTPGLNYCGVQGGYTWGGRP